MRRGEPPDVPTSDPANIPPVVIEMILRSPDSVLDLGAGFGKYGVLVREYLDIGRGRISRDSWHIRLVGVDGFSPYRSSLHDAVYDEFYVENFLEGVSRYRGFDLVLMLDSLEHLERTDGESLLRALRAQNRHLIVSCPDGDCPQGAVNGNEFERHRSTWTETDFLSLGGRTLHKGVCVVSSIPGHA